MLEPFDTGRELAFRSTVLVYHFGKLDVGHVGVHREHLFIFAVFPPIPDNERRLLPTHLTVPFVYAQPLPPALRIV